MAALHKGADHDLPSQNGVSFAEHVDMENTRELSLMRAFAQRRRPESTGLVALGIGTSANGPAAVPHSSVVVEEPKKKKKNFKKRGFWKFIPCVSAGAEADEGGQAEPCFRNNGVSPACAGEGETQQSGVDALTTKLIEIANSSFIPPEIETDAEEGEIEKLAGLLLRQCGDTMDQDYDCANKFMEMMSSYSAFGKLMSTIFHKIGLPTNEPGDRGPKGSDEIRTNMAVTCEVATRLSAMDTHPMSRALGFGAQYLKEHYPLEEALNADEDQDIDMDVD